MKQRKSVNTFQKFQEAKQTRRERLIVDYLTMLEKTRVSFKYVTDLAKHVAVHIGKVEEGQCNPATLLRNDRYKALLLSYMASLASGTNSIRRATISDPAANALLVGSDLTISNLQRENARLLIYIEQLEARLAAQERNAAPALEPPSLEKSVNGDISHDYKYKYIRTCQSLRLVMDYLVGQFEVDADCCVLKDATKRRGDNVVVQSDNIKPYVEWLNQAQ